MVTDTTGGEWGLGGSTTPRIARWAPRHRQAGSPWWALRRPGSYRAGRARGHIAYARGRWWRRKVSFLQGRRREWGWEFQEMDQ